MNSKKQTLCLILLIFSQLLWSQTFSKKGAELYNNGRFQQAIDYYLSLEKKSQLTATDQALYGMCYLKTGNIILAEVIIQKIRNKRIDNPYVFLAQAYLAFEKQNFKKAYEIFERLYKKDRFMTAAKQGLKAAAVNQGLVEYKAKNLDKAKKWLNSVLKIDPPSFEALKNLGIIYLETDEFQKAANYFKQAVEIQKNDVSLWELFLYAREKQGSQKDILGALEKLVVLKPNHPEYWAKLARFHETNTSMEYALEFYKKAAQWNSQKPSVYMYLAEHSIKNKNKQEARYHLHEAIGKYVVFVSQLRLQAARVMDQDISDLTEAQIQSIQELSKEIEGPLLRLKKSINLLKNNALNNREFEEDMIMLSKWYPQNYELSSALGFSYIGSMAWNKAMEIFKKMAAKYPSIADVHKAMGIIYFKTNQKKLAEIAFKKALGFDKKNKEIYDYLYKLYDKKMSQYYQYLQDQLVMDKRNPVLLGELIYVSDKLGLTQESMKYSQRRDSL